MATAADIGLMICRAAEMAGWRGVAEYGDDSGWVIDVAPGTSVGVFGEPALGTLHLVADVLAVAEAVGTREEIFALLLTASGDISGANGLRFSLSPDGSRILLATSLPEVSDETSFKLVLSALVARAEGWRTVLAAPRQEAYGAPDDSVPMIRV